MLKVEEIDEIMNGFATEVVSELSDRKLYNIEEIRTLFKTRAYILVRSIIQKELDVLTAKKADVMRRMEGVDGKTQQKLQREIAVLKSNIKPRNIYIATMREYEEYKELAAFVIDRLGVKELESFNEEFRKGKRYRKQPKLTGEQRTEQ